jgi:hypothetical protein
MGRTPYERTCLDNSLKLTAARQIPEDKLPKALAVEGPTEPIQHTGFQMIFDRPEPSLGHH